MRKSALPIRSALEMLRLECPEYRIGQRVIADRLFYIADAIGPEVQPRFAQAETVDRLRSKLRVPEAEFSAEAPSIARVYDVLLGGKDNFAADREQAQHVLDIFPQSAELAIQARQFQAAPSPTWQARASASSLTSAAGCPPRRTPTKPPRQSSRAPVSPTSITTPRCSATPATCWPAAPACSPAPGT